MRKLSPGNTTLWISYQEDNQPVTGLTDLTVEAKYALTGSSVLSSQSLVEDGSSGDYYYTWDTSGINRDEIILVYYKKGSEVLFVEEVVFDIIEDQDGVML